MGRAHAHRRSRRTGLSSPRRKDWEQLDADADECVGEFCEHFRDCYLLLQTRRGQIRRSRRRQSRAVLSRSRDRRRTAAAVRRRRARRSAPVRTLGDRRVDRDCSRAPRSRECCANCAERTICRRSSKPSSTKACASSSRRLAASAAIAIRLPQTKMRGPRSTRCATTLYQSGELALCQRQGALKKRSGDDPAEADRRRDLALRLVRRARSRDRPIERGDADERLPGSSAATPTAVTPSTARRTRSRSFCRRALFAGRERRAHERDDRRGDVDVNPFEFRPSHPRHRGRARARRARPRSTTHSKRGSSSRRRTLNPKSSEFARRAAPLVEECLDRHARPRFRAVHVVRAACAKSTRCLRERLAFPVHLQGELPRAHLLDWFRERRTRCSLRPERFGKASTSPAMRSRA